jgi:hypothetical protein
MKYAYVLIVMGLMACADLQAQPGQKRASHSTLGRKRNNLPPSQYKIAQFDGRWQEVSRQGSKDKQPVSVTDTMYLNFLSNGTVEVTEGKSATITGGTTIEPGDYLNTSVNDYKIISISSNEMVLDDLNGSLRRFEKRQAFAFENPATYNHTIGDTSAGKIEITAANMIRNWFVYRRGANPGAVANSTPVIRNLKLSKEQGGVYNGEIEFAISGKVITEPCTFSVSGNDVTIKATTQNWNTKIYKADGKEMMLGKKGELVYYLKPF